MHTDRFDLGNLHWHVNRDGRVGLGVPNRPNREYPNGRYMGSDDYEYAASVPPERLGRWTHLAVVYDNVAGEVVH